jgi:predicted Zn-dependent peptidase
MAGIVFQNIRESRALAYGTFSSFQTPEKREDPFYILAYVGTQADKLKESIDAMNDLLVAMPRADRTFTAAREGLRNKIETDRITRTDLLFNYLAARKLGVDHDLRQDVYAGLRHFTLDDLAAFHDAHYGSAPYAYCIVGSKKRIRMKELKKYGKVVELSLKDIFGY